jgi:hypothetical protein
MWYKKEDGERFVTLKFTVDRIKIPFFNLISLLYETDLYHHWFPVLQAKLWLYENKEDMQSLLSGISLPLPIEESRSHCLRVWS